MKQMLTSGTSALALLIISNALLSGCQSEDTPPPVPMLMLNGVVERIDGEPQDAPPLEAALAFTSTRTPSWEESASGSGTGTPIYIVDGKTTGEFPGRYGLTVFDAPPDDVVTDLVPNAEGEPRGAIGYVIAAPISHGDFFAGGSGTGYSKDCNNNVTCVVDREFCSTFGACVVDTYHCPLSLREHYIEEPDWALCTLVTRSNIGPDRAPDLFFSLPGFVAGHFVLYLESDAAEGSIVAATFSDGSAIAAGYSLIEATFFQESAAQQLERVACEDDATSQAIAQVIAEADETFTPDEIAVLCARASHEICINYSLRRAQQLAQRDCPLKGRSFTRIDNAAEAELSMVLDDYRIDSFLGNPPSLW